MRWTPMVVVGLALGCVPHLQTPGGAGPEGWEPPDNDWPLQIPPEDLVGEGFYAGQVVPDFRLMDQHGQEVALWQFYGKVIALDISTMWCAPCQELARDVEHTWEDYRDEGFMYVTVLAENHLARDPDLQDLQTWATTFGITAPIVADPGKSYSSPAVGSAYPVLLVIDRDLRVTERVTPATDAALREAVERALAQ